MQPLNFVSYKTKFFQVNELYSPVYETLPPNWWSQRQEPKQDEQKRKSRMMKTEPLIPAKSCSNPIGGTGTVPFHGPSCPIISGRWTRIVIDRQRCRKSSSAGRVISWRTRAARFLPFCQVPRATGSRRLDFAPIAAKTLLLAALSSIAHRIPAPGHSATRRRSLPAYPIRPDGIY